MKLVVTAIVALTLIARAVWMFHLVEASKSAFEQYREIAESPPESPRWGEPGQADGERACQKHLEARRLASSRVRDTQEITRDGSLLCDLLLGCEGLWLLAAWSGSTARFRVARLAVKASMWGALVLPIALHCTLLILDGWSKPFDILIGLVLIGAVTGAVLGAVVGVVAGLLSTRGQRREEKGSRNPPPGTPCQSR